jgi:hypothetical protein
MNLLKPKKEQLEEAIKKNPKYEQNYIDLIVSVFEL